MSEESTPPRPPAAHPSLSPSQTASQPPSQAASQPSQYKASQPKIWALAGGNMRVVSHGKKKPSDNYMVLQLEFSFDHDPKARKVGKRISLVSLCFHLHFVL